MPEQTAAPGTTGPPCRPARRSPDRVPAQSLDLRHPAPSRQKRASAVLPRRVQPSRFNPPHRAQSRAAVAGSPGSNRTAPAAYLKAIAKFSPEELAVNKGPSNGDHHIGSAWDGQLPKIAPIRIGQNVWIGAAAIGGVTVGDRAVVAAGSVASRDVVSATLVAGVPARAIRTSYGRSCICCNNAPSTRHNDAYRHLIPK